MANGCIRPRGDAGLPSRLRDIFSAIVTLVEEYAPQEVAVERVFVARNVDSALKLGQARGAALCAVTMRAPLPVFEYSPREIKQAVAGRGGAEKTQVQTMVQLLLGTSGALQADAADALAVALCRTFVRRSAHLLAAGTERQAMATSSPSAHARPTGNDDAADLLRQAHAWRTRRRRK